jgi:hypothetical protein
MTFKTLGFGLTLSVMTVFICESLIAGEAFTPPADGIWDWCGTQRVYEQRYKASHNGAAAPEACDQNGPCDDPTERDTWIPDGSRPIQYVRMIIHLLAQDDGSNVFSTPQNVAAQVAQLNADYAPVGIQFVYQLHQINSSAWRSLAESEINAMKTATAIQPDKYLNVWVTIVEFSYSFSTFPWTYEALQPTGGIVMGHFHWVDVPNKTFAHEVGHALGLYHTFHGVDEVSACSSCYESPQSNSSLIGDLCADTPPTPTNQGNCANPYGSDPCSGLSWGNTMPENFMSYANQTCLTTFTPEQRGRIRCWSNSVIDSWSIPFQVAATPVLGPAPLAVDFAASSHKDAIGWNWDLGDGNTAAGASPSHVYTEPGLRSIAVDMQTSEKLYQQQYNGMIAVYADTLDILNGRVDGTATSVLVYARNYLPLNSITIPFIYAGDFDLKYDSVSTAGLRSSGMSVRTVSWVENQNKATVAIEAKGGISLAPGSGPVARIYFTAPQSHGTGTVPIEITSYSSHNLVFVTQAGTYLPVNYGGTVRGDCCQGIVGDANGDGSYEPTISDISVIIDHLFISGDALTCYLEADVNQSGGITAEAKDITIGDISVLIDHLFISGIALPECQ